MTMIRHLIFVLAWASVANARRTSASRVSAASKDLLEGDAKKTSISDMNVLQGGSQQGGSLQGPEQLVATVQAVLAHPVVVTGRIGWAGYGVMAAEPKLILSKNSEQRKLMVSDLTDELQAVDGTAAKTEASLASDFDFSQSLEAFNNAAANNWNLLNATLERGNPPEDQEECASRFRAALVDMQKPFCEAMCKDDKACDCEAKLAETHEPSDLEKLISSTGDEVCGEYSYWTSGEGATTLEKSTLLSTRARMWPRYVDIARDKLRTLLTKAFPSPAAVTISAHSLLVDYDTKIVTNCAQNSSWWNPLGKLAHAVRRAGDTKEAVPRDIVSAKSAQIKKYIHHSVCPAFQFQACRARCNGFESYCEEKDLLPEEESGGFVEYTEAYCGQMREFATTVQPVCNKRSARFGEIKKGVMSTVSLASDLMSISGLASFTIFLTMWNDPNQALDINQILVAAGAIRSAAYLLGRMSSGWMNASSACHDIAQNIINASASENVTEGGQ